MDTAILCMSVCFLALFTHPVLGEDGLPPLKVSFENDTTVQVSEGAELVKFRCRFNRGAVFVINNNVLMVHVDPVSGNETVLTKSANMVEGSSEFYSITLDQRGLQEMVLDFTIVKVRYQDDGQFVCRVSPGNSNPDGETAQAQREVLVHRPMSDLTLKFGDFEAISESPTDPIQIDHGQYHVTCTALGSNPGTEHVHLYFHGKELSHEAPTPTLMEMPQRMYSSQVDATVDIMVSNSGQEVECQAKDSTGTSKSVKLSVSVNIYDPEVRCNDTDAFHGQANPTLFCSVNHTGLEVDGYAYQMGDTGETFRPGDKNLKNIVVSTTDVSPGITVVSMDLHRAEKEYLDKNFYILIDLKGGHTSKEMVRLNEVEASVTPPVEIGDGGPDNGAARLSSFGFLSALTLTLTSLMLWLL